MPQNWGRFRSQRPAARVHVEDGTDGGGDGKDGEGGNDSGSGCGCGCAGLIIGVVIGALIVTWAGPPEALNDFIDYIRSLIQ